MNVTTDNIYQDNEPEITIQGDKAYVYEPIRDGALVLGYAKKFVMEKEAFQKMYEEWIVKAGLDRRIL